MPTVSKNTKTVEIPIDAWSNVVFHANQQQQQGVAAYQHHGHPFKYPSSAVTAILKYVLEPAATPAEEPPKEAEETGPYGATPWFAELAKRDRLGAIMHGLIVDRSTSLIEYESKFTFMVTLLDRADDGRITAFALIDWRAATIYIAHGNGKLICPLLKAGFEIEPDDTAWGYQRLRRFFGRMNEVEAGQAILTEIRAIAAEVLAKK